MGLSSPPTEMRDEELAAIEDRCKAASPAPWTAFVENRDHTCGDSFIRLAGLDDYPDMYVSHDTQQAPSADLDFIAHARQDIPRLLVEIRRLRSR
jgi:hypothetical protein